MSCVFVYVFCILGFVDIICWWWYVCVAGWPVVKVGVSRGGPEKQSWSQGETQERERGPSREVREEGKEREKESCWFLELGVFGSFGTPGLLASVSRPLQTCPYAKCRDCHVFYYSITWYLCLWRLDLEPGSALTDGLVCLYNVVSDGCQCHSILLAFNCLVLCWLFALPAELPLLLSG